MLLWLVALPGVIAAAVLGVPAMQGLQPPPVPIETLVLAAGLQSAVLAGVAAVAGARLAPAVALRSPLLEGLVARRRIPELRSLALAGVLGGVAGAALLLGLSLAAPHALAAAREAVAVPLAVRLLYGGITEEVLMRWGLMTACLWVLWRIGQRGRGRPRPLWVAIAIGLSALLFGLGHLPAAAAVVPSLDVSVVGHVVAGNALFGVLAGYLYWKHGLESAIAAHFVAHLLAYGVGG